MNHDYGKHGDDGDDDGGVSCGNGGGGKLCSGQHCESKNEGEIGVTSWFLT